MEYKDYYKILDVNRKTTTKEIEKAYRKLARKYHPNVNPDNKEAKQKFKEINKANEVLSDQEKRRKYDELGANWKQYDQWKQAGGRDGEQPPFDRSQFGFAQGGSGRPGYEYHTLNEEEMEGLFGSSGPFPGFSYTFSGGPESRARGKQRTTRQPQKGQDVEQPIEISLEEAYHGTTRSLQMTAASGKIHRIEAKIPAGVYDGSRVRLAGQGMPGDYNGPRGDMYLVVHVFPHRFVERRGDDLHLKLTVPLTTAMLGGETEVPTLNGRVMLKIPPETQNGKSFRLKGKGMPKLQYPQQHGDLYAEVNVKLPEKLSERERELFKELASLRSNTGN